jgi:hypothetical protein
VRVCKHYVPWKLLFLVIAEMAIIIGSVYVSLMIQYLEGNHKFIKFYSSYRNFIAITLLTFITFYIADLYDISIFRRKTEFFIKIILCYIFIYFSIVSINYLII